MSILYNLLKRNTVTTNINNMAKTGTINESNESNKANKECKEWEKGKADNSPISKQPELPDSITYNGCKQVFTDKDAKILCCDHCETGTAPNLHKFQMQDTTSYQVKKLKTHNGFAKPAYNQQGGSNGEQEY